MIGDLRNLHQIEVARAKGGYLDTIPKEWIGNPRIWLEPKTDDVRMTFQFDTDRNWSISRNREDKLKGVDKAGDFVNWSDKLPHLTGFRVPQFAGLMLDGGVYCSDIPAGGRGASVSTYMKECPEKLTYRTWDMMFDVDGKDIRDWPQHARRDRLDTVVRLLGAPFIQIMPKLPSTMEEIQKLWDAGWEGGILKDSDARYRGTNAWRKCKAANPIDAFILAPLPEKKGGSPKNGIKPTATGRAKGFLLGMKSRATGKVVKVGWMMWELPERDMERGVKFFKKEYEGRVVCASASGFDGEGFRWLRFKEWRNDEPGTVKECILEDQIGEKALAGVEE